MFAVILAVGLMLAINFSSRILADRDLQQVQNSVRQEIELLKREQADLTEQLGYVQSDAYVENWARSEGKMIKEGEILIFPQPSSLTVSTTPPPENLAQVETALPDQTPWVLWWQLFFDTPPP
jgi:cell division protein FtsB